MALGSRCPTGSHPSGISAGLTGQLLLLVMIVIYAGAHDKVKRSHYETFWYSHHFFVAWFLLLLLHGPVWWCSGRSSRSLPYAIDRLVRVFYRGKQRIALARVYFWGKPRQARRDHAAVRQRFDDKGVKPVQYMEGHYLYLCCPAVETSAGTASRSGTRSPSRRRPTSRSSRSTSASCRRRYAWTNKVAQLPDAARPQQDGRGRARDAQPDDRRDDPRQGHRPRRQALLPRRRAARRAVAARVPVPEAAMLVGAGIGVTPCASIMKGIVNYRWKKGFTPVQPPLLLGRAPTT